MDWTWAGLGNKSPKVLNLQAYNLVSYTLGLKNEILNKIGKSIMFESAFSKIYSSKILKKIYQFLNRKQMGVFLKMNYFKG